MTSDDRATSFLRLIRRAEHGRLKIYLGYAAGVGKTYQMLLEGHRLQEEAVEVVVGFVETHGREETARLIDGLEVIPRKLIEYRGVGLEEMDLEALLARKPQVALIDELAHTNVPGSRNVKRYQDVEQVLAAGIHVIATLNIQHLESLCDTVESEVRVKVRERIPDAVVAEADQIVNVDLTAEDLRQRLEEGKVYPPDRVGTALENFFAKQHLETLRELTLRETAAQIDLRRREQSEEEVLATPDQLMVCLSSAGPNSEMLLRYASRLAGRLNRNWYAVYVRTPDEEPTVIDAQTQHILSGTLTLAKQLGAIVFTYKGHDIVDTILRFAREYRVGHIVIGSPGPLSRWKRMLGRRNLVERLIDGCRGATVVVLDTRKGEAATEERQYETASPLFKPASRQAANHMRLSTFLSPRRIVIWHQPVSKSVVLGTLVEAAVADIEPGREQEILEQITKREAESSTFWNEGVAFPHARLEGITFPVVCLGIPLAGVSDLPAERSTGLVFLLLTPANNPDVQIRMLSLAGKVSRHKQWYDRLASAGDAEQAFARLRDAEDALSAERA